MLALNYDFGDCEAVMSYFYCSVFGEMIEFIYSIFIPYTSNILVYNKELFDNDFFNGEFLLLSRDELLGVGILAPSPKSSSSTDDDFD